MSTILFILPFLVGYAILVIYAERKLSALMQDRLGPMEVGYSGMLQMTWNIFRMPLLFFAWIIFFIASLAESNRAPFDLPEVKSELAAGYHAEYSGFITGRIWGIFWLISKTLLIGIGCWKIFIA